MMKVNQDVIQLYVDQGYLTRRKHPTEEVYILNYTQKTQYEKHWNEVTRACRGLMVDSRGEVIARPFPKFFNLNEVEETQEKNLPDTVPSNVYAKKDGMLIIQYYVGDKVCGSTRGSFESDGAKIATRMLSQFKPTDFLPGYTYLYELISPETRIVVDYRDERSLYLLAVINTKTGGELDPIFIARLLNKEKPNKVIREETEILTTINNLKAECTHAQISGLDAEGWVARYDNGLRIKFKYEDYKRLHRILTRLSSIGVWEAMRADKYTELLDTLPDEMFGWVEAQRARIMLRYDDLMERAKTVFIENNLTGLSRREQAEIINKYPKTVRPLAFYLLDGRGEEASRIAWTMCKPEYETYREEPTEDI